MNAKYLLKVTIEAFSKCDFLGLKSLSPSPFWGAPTHANIIKL